MSQYSSNAPNFGTGAFAPIVDCIMLPECRERVASHARSAVEIVTDGAYSLGEDIVFAGHRTLEGLGGGRDGRVAEIGYENRVIFWMIYDSVKYGLDGENAPLHILIVIIIMELLACLPDDKRLDLEEKAEKAAKNKGWVMAARTAVAVPTLKIMTLKAVKAVQASATYKFLVFRLGVSGAATLKWPYPLGLTLLVTIQGTLQRASRGAARLQAKVPKLFGILAKKDLQFLYFLVEEVLDPYVNLISMAEKLAKEGKSLETVDAKCFQDLLFWEFGNGR